MRTILITGADGHVGKALASWLIERSDSALVLYVRARGRDEEHKKRQALGSLAHSPRCRIVYSDLRDASPFSDVVASDIDAIVHAAAVTSFAVEQGVAESVNVEGTQKLLEFARSCRGLQRFVLVSSLYSAGLQAGVIEEIPHASEPQFANHYEWSKWHAEHLVAKSEDIPWQIYRVATIVGEDDGGVVVQQNAIHNTLRLLYYGLLSVVPGNAATRVYTTTTAAVTGAIGPLMNEGAVHTVFHIADRGDNALTLGQLIDVIYGVFSADPGFAKMQILKPLFCDQKTFDTLTGAISRFSGPMHQSLQSVTPFAPQLFCDKHVNTSNAGTFATHSDAAALLTAVARYLVQSRWGLKLPGTAVSG